MDQAAAVSALLTTSASSPLPTAAYICAFLASLMGKAAATPVPLTGAQAPDSAVASMSSQSPSALAFAEIGDPCVLYLAALGRRLPASSPEGDLVVGLGLRVTGER